LYYRAMNSTKLNIDHKVQTIGFLLIPGFALMSYASAIEPLRAANQLAKQNLFDWVHITPDGQLATATCGATIPNTVKIGNQPKLDILFVCAGGDPASFEDIATFAWLRKLAKHGIRLGGISGGPFILAHAGVMNGRHMTIHWEHAPILAEAYPDLLLTRSLYIFDRDRVTCAGGIASLDMMHALITERCGTDFATQVSDWLLHNEIRPASGPQRSSLTERYGVHRRELITALELMEHNISEPLDRRSVAAHVNLSTRQLDRLFSQQLGKGFSVHYKSIRLQRAHDLLRSSPLTITEIAFACGFSSASHFSRTYQSTFGQNPSSARFKQ